MAERGDSASLRLMNARNILILDNGENGSDRSKPRFWSRIGSRSHDFSHSLGARSRLGLRDCPKPNLVSNTLQTTVALAISRTRRGPDVRGPSCSIYQFAEW